MICDQDPPQRRTRKSTVRKKQWERCVWMTKKLAEWASEQGQITKIRPSDASRGKAIPTVVQFGYDRHKSEGYLGNVGLGQTHDS